MVLERGNRIDVDRGSSFLSSMSFPVRLNLSWAEEEEDGWEGAQGREEGEKVAGRAS